MEKINPEFAQMLMDLTDAEWLAGTESVRRSATDLHHIADGFELQLPKDPRIGTLRAAAAILDELLIGMELGPAAVRSLVSQQLRGSLRVADAADIEVTEPQRIGLGAWRMLALIATAAALEEAVPVRERRRLERVAVFARRRASPASRHRQLRLVPTAVDAPPKARKP